MIVIVDRRINDVFIRGDEVVEDLSFMTIRRLKLRTPTEDQKCHEKNKLLNH